MKKISKLLLLMAAGLILTFSGCADSSGDDDNDSGSGTGSGSSSGTGSSTGSNTGSGSGSDNSKEPEEFTIMTSSTGNFTNTTWIFSSTDEQTDWVDPTPPSSGGDENPGTGDGNGDSGSGGGNEPQPTPQPQQTAYTYLHINSGNDAYYGKVTVWEKWNASDDCYEIDNSRKSEFTYEAHRKGTAKKTADGYLEVKFPYTTVKNETDMDFVWEKQDYSIEDRYENSKGLSKASAKVLFRKTSDGHFTLQTQKNDPDHSGCTLTTQYYWISFPYDAKMLGPSEEFNMAKVIYENDAGVPLINSKLSYDSSNDCYYTRTKDTDKVADVLLGLLTLDISSSAKFCIVGSSGTVYFSGSGTLQLNQENFEAAKSSKKFSEVTETAYTIKKLVTYSVSVRLTTSGLSVNACSFGDYSSTWTGNVESTYTVGSLFKEKLKVSTSNNGTTFLNNKDTSQYEIKIKIVKNDDENYVYYDGLFNDLMNDKLEGITHKLSDGISDDMSFKLIESVTARTTPISEDKSTGISSSSGNGAGGSFGGGSLPDVPGPWGPGM